MLTIRTLFVTVVICLFSSHVMAANFKLCDVDIPDEIIPEKDYGHVLERMYGPEISASSSKDYKLIESSYNSFIFAVEHSFAEHRPLIISPDMIWLLICQGLAFHVYENEEDFREQIVGFEGKKELIIRRDNFVLGNEDNDWQSVFPEFRQKIAEYSEKSLCDFIDANFSTTGPVEKVSFDITLMKSVEKYFSYRVDTMCGIPNITLEGTTEDWELIYQRIEELSKWGLDKWVNKLDSILHEFVEASKGNVNHDFWSSIYRKNGMSGTRGFVDGWVSHLFPYIVNYQNKMVKNNRVFDIKKEAYGLPVHDPGISKESFPNGMNRVNFIWNYYGEHMPMDFLAGFAGVAQNKKTKALRPEITWVVRKRQDSVLSPLIHNEHEQARQQQYNEFIKHFEEQKKNN